MKSAVHSIRDARGGSSVSVVVVGSVRAGRRRRRHGSVGRSVCHLRVREGVCRIAVCRIARRVHERTNEGGHLVKDEGRSGRRIIHDTRSGSNRA